jgi:hypothetical protein
LVPPEDQNDQESNQAQAPAHIAQADPADIAQALANIAQASPAYFTKKSLPDINIIISTSDSILASLGLAGAFSPAVSAHFDVQGAKKLNLKLTGVKSDRMDQDELFKSVKDNVVLKLLEESGQALDPRAWKEG